MKTVLIKWYDSYTINNGWSDKKDTIKHSKKPLIIKSCGLLVREDKKCIVICHSFDGANINGVFYIPKTAIINITKLKR